MNQILNKQHKKVFYHFSAMVLFIFSILNSAAQPYKRFNYLPVSRNDTLLRYAWTGGVNSIQTGKTDVNRDGKKDLIVFDKNNKKFLVFIAQAYYSTEYRFDHNYAENFPPVSGWCILKDYNCDGLEDLFTYNNIANLKVYTAYYESDTLKYKLQQDGFFYQGSSGTINVYCSDVIKPAIADINKDGDLDIISFNVFGNRLIYYENQKTELSLPCDSLFFTKADNCWGNVLDSFAASYALNDTCSFKFNRINGNEQILHTGSSIDAADLDANETSELLIGSVSLNNLTLLNNNGTKNYASVQQQDISFPSYNVPFNVSAFGAPTFLDVNNDGATDLLVSTFDAGAANINNIWYYKNTKTSGTPSIELALQQKNFLLDLMIDAGENSNPCFFDADGDGLTDIVIGSGGLKDNINPAIYKLQWYKNTGTIAQPKYNLHQDDYLSVSTLNVKDLVPAAGDLDNDNDNDLVVGIADGRMIYWENTAGFGNAPILVYRGLLKDSSNVNISIGANAAPFLIDMDKDGKTDLIIGERNGNLNFYKGNAIGNIRFSYVTDSLGKVRIKTNGLSIGFTHPVLADMNNDNKYDLILGTNSNGLQFYSNVEDNLNTEFTLSTPLITDNLGLRTSAAVADISGDGKPELLCGNTCGGLIIFSQDPPPNPTAVKQAFSKIDMQVYPNPATNMIFIEQEALQNKFLLQVFDIIGHELIRKEYQQKNISLNINTIPSGIYFIKISDGEKEGIKKIIIQH